MNANVTLRYRGVGGITDAIVSIDLYADNSSAVGVPATPEGAVVHEEVLSPANAKSSTYTTVRVLFPPGFDVCDSVIALQGNMSGVSLTQTDGSSRNVPFYRSNAGGIPGSTRGVGAPRVTETDLENRRTGIDQDLFDNFVGSDFADRLFEMRSFGISSRTSVEAGQVERMQFVISNIRNAQSPGEIVSPIDREEEVFAVRVFKSFVPANGGVVHTLRYYNNRINDVKLNHTMLPWFSGTSISPVTLVTNQLWETALVFDEMKTLQKSNGTLTFQTFSAVPPGGSVRIQFPPGFDVSDVTGMELHMDTDYGPTRFYKNDPPGSVTLVRQYDESIVCDLANDANSIQSCLIQPNERFRVRIYGVLTISAEDSTFVDGGFQTDSFEVRTMSGQNETLDSGEAAAVILGPAALSAPSVGSDFLHRG